MNNKKTSKMDPESVKSLPFFVGTYSDKGPYVPEANGKGLLSCTLNLESGEIRQNGVCEEAYNSTYLDKSPDGNFIFAACDMFSSNGNVKALKKDDHGSLQVISSVNAHGTSTCHVACDHSGTKIFVSNYLNGVVTAHKFDGEKIGPASQIISYEGSGPNQERQEAAHAHQALVSPNNRWVYVCDLGSDKIWIHEGNELFEKSYSTKSLDTPAGYGPRHLVWNAGLPKVYVLSELNSHILVYDWNEETGNLTLQDDIAALPKEYKGEAAGSAIRLHPSNKALYISDRGQNSIIVHSIDEQNGSLTFEDWFSIKGETPRDFNIDPTGQWLLSANQDSDLIVPFQLDPETGLPIGENGPQFECGTPVCVLF